MKEMYRYWLASIPGISGKKKLDLCRIFGEEREIYKQTEDSLKIIPELSAAEIGHIINSKKGKNLESEYHDFLKKDIQLIYYDNENYPEKLKHIYDMPYCLFLKGNMPDSQKKIVAVVGARNCSGYGRVVAEDIGRCLGEKEIEIISGMAYGIDSMAHRGALEGHGNTYAVLGCGVDVCYPSTNRKLYEHIQKNGGVLSEYPCGTQPLPYYFPQRNRIISALSDIVIVVEAKKRSGSLITADFALEQGKTVYAVPGRIHDEFSFGTNWLLSQGAMIFYSMDEFLKDIGEFSQKSTINEKLIENSLEKNERLVYSVLDLTPKYLENILEESGLELLEVLNVLRILIKNGYVKEADKNYFRKTSV